MMVVSLKESCLRILTAHSIGLVEVGNCPYRLIRPVLFACQPDQLAHIEDCSPHLMLDSDEIWAVYLSRDFPNEPLHPATATNAAGSCSPGPPSQALEDQEDYSFSSSSSSLVREVDLPPNRIHYFKIRLAKEEALASASARLREKVQASRSDQLKRKAIFTGLTDYGAGSQKKKLNGSSKSWGSYTPTGKTLAEKARQQVKKSAAVYANAVKAKASLVRTPNSIPNSFPRATIPSARTSSTITPIFSIRKPLGKTPSPRCVVRMLPTQPPGSKQVVQSPSASTAIISPVRPPTRVHPNPFPQPKPPRRTGPLTTPLHKPVPPSSASRPSVHPPPPPPPPPPTAALLKSKVLDKTSSSYPMPSSPSKTSSLFMPKKLKPPPQQPSKSLIYRPASSSK
ncbi:hypothetical protein PCANC_20132 [Puccinia coronata f. sp. avenae]|uniref:Elongin-A n=1 Tax=Puccinia coronata f. sp. avenae TaxID=200324 RepID=A0A2N5TWE9_9BASI|nr:hypothetical protein PCANC_20132 [Puccinia coronata f. sp. avenae]